MATEFTMPKLGLTMEEGTIVEWLVAAETTVAPGSAVLVIDTDKTQTEVEIPDGGRLVLVGEVGETYKCGEVIGYLLAEGETAPVALAPTTAAAIDATGRVMASPYARVRAKELGVDILERDPFGPHRRLAAQYVRIIGSAL